MSHASRIVYPTGPQDAHAFDGISVRRRSGDLEALCKRVIIVNHGQIVYEDKVSNLKRKFLTSKLVEVRYAQEVPRTFQVEGADMIKLGQYGVKLRFDSRETPVEKVLSHLTQAGSVVDITISDPPLEEVIAKIYQTQDFAPGHDRWLATRSFRKD